RAGNGGLGALRAGAVTSRGGGGVVPLATQVRERDRGEDRDSERKREEQEEDNDHRHTHECHCARRTRRRAAASSAAARLTPEGARRGRAGARQPSSGNQIAISRAADSSESEPWTRFWITGRSCSQERSPRMVPGAASVGLVAPARERKPGITLTPSATTATSGAEPMYSTRPG